MEEDAVPPHGHITSLAVLRTHRKCGIATNLMRQAHARMQESFGASYCSLHVRYTNMAAFHLYSQTLSYKIHDIEKSYYADGEDAYSMRCEFTKVPKEKKSKSANPTTLPPTPSTPASAPSEEMNALTLQVPSAAASSSSSASPMKAAASSSSSSQSSAGGNDDNIGDDSIEGPCEKWFLLLPANSIRFGS